MHKCVEVVGKHTPADTGANRLCYAHEEDEKTFERPRNLLELVNGQLVGDVVREKKLEIFTGEEARNGEHRLEGARE